MGVTQAVERLPLVPKAIKLRLVIESKIYACCKDNDNVRLFVFLDAIYDLTSH
jgi:hypothetical protein